MKTHHPGWSLVHNDVKYVTLVCCSSMIIIITLFYIIIYCHILYYLLTNQSTKWDYDLVYIHLLMSLCSCYYDIIIITEYQRTLDYTHNRVYTLIYFITRTHTLSLINIYNLWFMLYQGYYNIVFKIHISTAIQKRKN